MRAVTPGANPAAFQLPTERPPIPQIPTFETPTRQSS